MAITTGTLTEQGGIVDVLVGVAENRRVLLRKVNFPVPEYVPVRAQLDTGSFYTIFHTVTFHTLGLKPYDVRPVRTPSTKPGYPHMSAVYNVNLILVSGEGNKEFSNIPALAGEDFDESEGVNAILGRDILKFCVLEYFGPDARFRLSF